MAQIKKYELEDDSYNEVHLEVDHSVLTKEIATEINEFWSDADSRLSDCDDVIKDVLKLVFCTIVGLMRHKGWDCINSRNAESFTKDFQSEEGWGQCGIKVTYVDIPQLDFADISIKVVP